MDYLPRDIDALLKRYSLTVPALSVEGARGVGKTATTSRLANTILEVDRAGARATLEASWDTLDVLQKPVLIDEWQRLPAVWDAVRRAVDGGASAGSYYLTGSATPHPAVDTHTGAGRILSVRMRPLALHERGLQSATVSVNALLSNPAFSTEITGESSLGVPDYLSEITASGFPGIRTNPAEIRREYLDSYIRAVVDRDLPEQGLAIRSRHNLENWWRAYAEASSTTASYTAILEAATQGVPDKPAASTTLQYREMLMGSWSIEPQPAFQPRTPRWPRLARSVKHQLADPALAAALLRVSTEDLLLGRAAGWRDGVLAGRLFESLAALSLRSAAEVARAQVTHLRTQDGSHEVDFLLQSQLGKIVAFEVKLADAVGAGDCRHLHWLRERLGVELVDMVVINTGSRAYRRDDGIGVVPLGLLGA